MSKEVIIIGAGGHGKVIADVVRSSGDTVLGFLDDDLSLPSEVCGIPVLGTVSDFTKFPEAWFIVGTGKVSSRHRITKLMEGVRWYTAIHPSAVISDMGVQIGEGSVVMACAVINPCVKIGRHCIINTGAIVDHNGLIGNYAHISVGAKLAGTVTVGENAWIGIGAVVSNNLCVCDECVVGAGSVVVRSIEEPGTYVGIPVRKIK